MNFIKNLFNWIADYFYAFVIMPILPRKKNSDSAEQKDGDAESN